MKFTRANIIIFTPIRCILIVRSSVYYPSRFFFFTKDESRSEELQAPGDTRCLAFLCLVSVSCLVLIFFLFLLFSSRAARRLWENAYLSFSVFPTSNSQRNEWTFQRPFSLFTILYIRERDARCGIWETRFSRGHKRRGDPREKKSDSSQRRLDCYV